MDGGLDVVVGEVPGGLVGEEDAAGSVAGGGQEVFALGEELVAADIRYCRQMTHSDLAFIHAHQSAGDPGRP
ncbi:hypothetical protein ACIBSR_24790 [Streptomyces sp. NPDC049936]|uniref:hypothetical protein n=1 Tax=Streptomyces sp. NPDC049936 TaxID=3365599 RepID=UPI00378A4155